MNKQSVLEIFEQISDSVISFLENHPGVTEVEFNERHGVSDAQLQSWEEEHSPCTLPEDMRSFLLISDGLLLQWKIKMNAMTKPLGQMHFNSLKDIIPFRLDNYILKRLGDDPIDTSNEKITVFDLDKKVLNGRLGLVYQSSQSKPQIYFQDLSGEWFFIANSFTDYFRLMVMHLGLPNWQYAFTEVGLDTTSQQWFRFLSPERLAIDIKSRKKQVKKTKRQKKETKKDKVLIQGLKRRKNATGFYSQIPDEKGHRKKKDKKSKKIKMKKTEIENSKSN
jgi:tubulin polyglutamylase complex subunit 2